VPDQTKYTRNLSARKPEESFLEDLYDTEGLAEKIRDANGKQLFTKNSLDQQRYEGRGGPYIKLNNGKVRYHLPTYLAWMAEQQRFPGKQPVTKMPARSKRSRG
jgi:hypothetical protein